MQVEDFYTKILGIEEPWSISDVRLEKKSLVHVHLEHEEGLRWKCPCCERKLPIYDHSEERRWRHLDTCQYETWLHARIPRVKCPEHGVKQVLTDWAEPGSRFTLLFESHAIEVLTACEVVSSACDILRISWDQGWRLIERAVARGKARKKPRKMTRIGADEKAFAKGQSYMTIVCDADNGTVEYVADDRRKESLAGFFEELSPEQRGAIEAVAIDMHE
ncbi:MAG: transposase family protein, partial [Planctomycetota bacterium]